MAPFMSMNWINRRIVSILLFFFCLWFLSYRIIINNINIEAVPAENGVIDLRGFDLDRNVVSLSGDWQFYWGELFEHHRKKPGSVNFGNIPSSWNRYGKSWEGFGTYKVKLLFPDNNTVSAYSLYLNRVGSAYRLFINGVERGGNGVVGETFETEVPHRQTKRFGFDVKPGSEVILVIQVSNHIHATGGLKTGILLASTEKLETVALHFFLVDCISAILILSLTLIYSFVYVFRPDPVFLKFSIFLVLVCLYVLGTGENILMTVFPWIPYTFFMKLIHVATTFHIVLYNLVLVRNFRISDHLFLYHFINVASVVYGLIVVFFSVKTFVTVLPLFHIVLLIADFYWLYLLLRLSRASKDALIVFGGVFCYTVTVILEIAYVNQLTHNPRIIPLGFLFLTFSYILVSVKTFANSYYLVEKAENEKLIAIEVAREHQTKNKILTQTLTKSEAISEIERIRKTLDSISYIVSELGGCSVYDDNGLFLFDVDLTLKKIEEIFGPGDLLVRCAKGYVVNPSKAQKMVRSGRRLELVFNSPEIKGITVGHKYLNNMQKYLAKN